MNEKLYIAMPAYNEETNIESVVNEWYPIVEKHSGENGSRLVVVNDGSKDATSEKAKEMKKSRPLLEIVDKPNSGHGATILFAYDYALLHGADFIFQTDSDGQTRAEEFEQFWNLRNDFDFIVGHRNHREDGFSRIVVTKTLKFILRICFGVSITDANTPFRLMNSATLAECKKFVPKDFNLSNVILSVIYHKKKFRIKYIPITFRPRQGGKNSINLKNIFKIGKNALHDFMSIKRNLEKEGL